MKTTMKQWLIRLLGLIALLTTGGAVSGYSIALLSSPPKEVLQQSIPCPTKTKTPARNLQMLSTHRWAKGVVVLYSAVCPSEQRHTSFQRIVGHQVVRRDGMNWQVSSSGSFGNDVTPRKEQLIDYRTSKSAKPDGDRYMLLYGQVLSPKVTAVEATFNNGQILRDQSVDGVFALVAPEATGVCQVRVLGTDNQILQQADLVIPKQLHLGTARTQCLPVSRPL
jgi:hypothetical protein